MKKKLVITIGATAILALSAFGYKAYTKEPEIKTSELTLNYGSKLTDDHIKASNDVVKMDFKPELDSKKLGTQKIKVEVRNKRGITSSKDINVHIIDRESPKLDIKDSYKIQVGTELNLYKKVKATDNVDGDLSKKVKIADYDTNKVGTSVLKMSVTDSSDNTTEKEVKLEVLEYVKPVIEVDEQQFVMLGSNFDPRQGVKATDEKDGDITHKVVVEQKVDTSKVGSYPVVYTVEDSEGETHTAKSTIIVKEEPMKEAMRKKEENSHNGLERQEESAMTGLLGEIADDYQQKKQNKKANNQAEWDKNRDEFIGEVKKKVEEETKGVREKIDENVTIHKPFE
ncbi:cell surface protein [Bacillus toyonensis]|uniref:immunoglobulin-like domain-containing protein n=1 Tax=Bacillus toyonensis TaxID=155322 RepID=UPI000BFC19F3|nr:immunoglobulin-like domain-containing protein [Bacillus toyonensis]PHE64312.1 cell surface protein [Bacillus toyonensis]